MLPAKKSGKEAAYERRVAIYGKNEKYNARILTALAILLVLFFLSLVFGMAHILPD